MIDLEDGKFKVTVSIILLKENKLLLQLRDNTGYLDGFYDLGVSGHVNSNENFKKAAVREASEELGLKISPEKLVYVTLIQNIRDNYIYIYFLYNITKNEEINIKNNEPNQIKDLLWVKPSSLPENSLPHNIIALKNYESNILYDIIYDEIGDD